MNKRPLLKKRKNTERFLLKIVKGGMVPADGYTESRLRDKGSHIGDIVISTITKPRSPKFHRMMHAFGKLCAENIDVFNGLDAHGVLKRVQWEADINCDLLEVNITGIGLVKVRIPQSLSFSSMDEGSFKETYLSMARYIADEYWTDLTDIQIQEMSELMPDE